MILLDKLRGGIVVSCQPVDDGPMDDPSIVAAMAAAAIAGGAVGVRIEGVDKLQAVRAAISAPIIGIVKQDTSNSDVRITPRISQVQALVAAGADIVAYDATPRWRQDSRESLVQAILKLGVLAMADCATREDGLNALEQGAAILGTTLSGYTQSTATSSNHPDFNLVTSFRQLVQSTSGFVMAEGRYHTPALAAQALRAGADAVTVGSALTRLELMTRAFTAAVQS